MTFNYKPFLEVPQLSGFDKAYVSAAPALRSFYKYNVDINAFKDVIKDKQKENINRFVLKKIILEQYENIHTSDAVRKNIEKLGNDNTFTVITAHQPSLFTGHLYFIYKIISTINLTEQLAKHYPDKHFVPVFWIGGEDHDFEEINHVHLFGKKIVWENEEKGATGMMKTDSLHPVLEEVKSILGHSDKATHLCNLLENCYTSHETYGKATFALVDALFQQYGLVTFSGNHRELKRLFLPIIKEELIKQTSQQLISPVLKAKEEAGFKPQATPREINLFYLKENVRERIVFENGVFRVLNTNLSFSETEMLEEAEHFPERFSPNVILRPLYQELLFPNLAYVGGGGELAYWTERLPQFEHFNINFPMLIRRNSVLWLDENATKKMAHLGLTFDDLFENTTVLTKKFLTKNAQNDLSLDEQKATVEQVFETILAKAKAIDLTLEKAVLGEKTKHLNGIIALESRLLKAEKKNQETAILQIQGLKDKYFPNGLQERHDNFLQYYLKYGEQFIGVLKEKLNPLNPDFVIITE